MEDGIYDAKVNVYSDAMEKAQAEEDLANALDEYQAYRTKRANDREALKALYQNPELFDGVRDITDIEAIAFNYDNPIAENYYTQLHDFDAYKTNVYEDLTVNQQQAQFQAQQNQQALAGTLSSLQGAAGGSGIGALAQAIAQQQQQGMQQAAASIGMQESRNQVLRARGQQALEMACRTWGDITPVVHYSESRSKEYDDVTIREQAHSDYIYDYIDTYGNVVDVMVEAKAKELAVMRYKELHMMEKEMVILITQLLLLVIGD